MSRARFLRHTIALGAVVAAACGTDTIELLPVGPGGSASGAGGSESSAGAPGPGGTVSGSGVTTGGGGSSGAASGTGGSAAAGGGSDSSGASGGGLGGCNGFGCGGFGAFGGDNGFGGDGECSDFHIFCPCGEQGRCGMGTKCNARIGLCLEFCDDNPLQCGEDGMICEEQTCALCSDNTQCELFGGFARPVCVNRRCEQCEGTKDCNQDSPFCSDNRCVQCRFNDDCPSQVCDKARGRCEK